MSIKGDLPLLTVPSSWLWPEATQTLEFIYFLDQITNLQKTTINDTANGQQKTDLITPSGLPLVAGFEVSYPANAISSGIAESYPDNNPKTAFGAKKLPLEYVPPSAVCALAEAFADGAKKYGPYNWREKSISSSVYYGAVLRHLTAWWDGEDIAEDSGIDHLYHALACISMLIDGKSVGKLNDNRPPKGAASQMQKNWIKDKQTAFRHDGY